jgi:hypothetical protein
MIEKLIDIYLVIYHWFREHVLRRPPQYAGRPVEISVRSEGGEWINLGDVVSFDMHPEFDIGKFTEEDIALPPMKEFKGHIVVAPRIDENGIKVDGDLFFDGFMKDKEETGDNPDGKP